MGFQIQKCDILFCQYSQIATKPLIMKYLTFLTFFLLAPFVFAQQQELNYSVDTQTPAIENNPSLEKKVEWVAPPKNTCSASKIKFLESASRKLYRAISGKGYKIKKLGLGSLRVGDQNFKVVPQKEGKVIGVFNASHAFGYVAINTTRGHIIARLKWSGCRPSETRILSPRVSMPNVDLEPFKYWGLRVLWNLPSRLGKSENMKESLTNMIKAD